MAFVESDPAIVRARSGRLSVAKGAGASPRHMGNVAAGNAHGIILVAFGLAGSIQLGSAGFP
jgi:hypothetical protein